VLTQDARLVHDDDALDELSAPGIVERQELIGGQALSERAPW
jgi:hypothetical protein